MDHSNHATMDHSGHDMASMATSLLSSAVSTAMHAMATGMDHSTMDHSTMDHSTMDHSTMDHSMGGMDHGDGGHMGMNMWLTTAWRDYPVLFKTMTASTGGKCFAIFCALFFTGMFHRGIALLRQTMEAKWAQADREKIKESGVPARTGLSGFFANINPVRDIIRVTVAFTYYMIGYALMLSAMSYVLVYFFAICLGLAFGEIFFNNVARTCQVAQIEDPKGEDCCC
ncbi:Copper transport protein [Yarrowia sp. C11]|nr:Copper transport protein [Yarrowia sp. E02]KAG5365256.1 Copper transport protein [Yarrowia sp. C11]